MRGTGATWQLLEMLFVVTQSDEPVIILVDAFRLCDTEVESINKTGTPIA